MALLRHCAGRWRPQRDSKRLWPLGRRRTAGALRIAYPWRPPSAMRWDPRSGWLVRNQRGVREAGIERTESSHGNAEVSRGPRARARHTAARAVRLARALGALLGGVPSGERGWTRVSRPRCGPSVADAAPAGPGTLRRGARGVPRVGHDPQPGADLRTVLRLRPRGWSP